MIFAISSRVSVDKCESAIPSAASNSQMVAGLVGCARGYQSRPVASNPHQDWDQSLRKSTRSGPGSYAIPRHDRFCRRRMFSSGSLLELTVGTPFGACFFESLLPPYHCPQVSHCSHPPQLLNESPLPLLCILTISISLLHRMQRCFIVNMLAVWTWKMDFGQWMWT
jgi:hypothetical protein